MLIGFKSGGILFCRGQIWFGGPCPGLCPGKATTGGTPGTLPTGQPSCCRLRRTDAALCGGCATVCGFIPAWNGILTWNGTATWSTPLSCTDGKHQLSAAIVFTANVFTLTLKCDTLAVLWSGTKVIGDNPCGTFIRTSGCDTTPRMYVY